jgi:hypothetical protein
LAWLGKWFLFQTFDDTESIAEIQQDIKDIELLLSDEANDA